MSVLARYLEALGIATTIIALMRMQAETGRPPRALWVPFELGRPIGPPGNPEFQTRVVRAALDLLDHAEGPVLEDFPEDEPDAVDNPNWVPPDTHRVRDLMEEIELLEPFWQSAVERNGRSTVGISGMDIKSAAEFVTRFDTDVPMPNPSRNFADVHALRYAVDDLKAYYLESANATEWGSSHQLAAWFWTETKVATTIRSLLENSFDHPDQKRRIVAWWLVPDAWIDEETWTKIRQITHD